jgi:putative pyruvate formate lyase activating enzyme
VDAKEFARICLALQNRGAENINIVTGTHAVPALVKAIAAARRDGAALDIPVLWNSSGYEVPETLDLLSDTVEVFLPDLKTLDSAVSERYFNAPDYPDRAVGAIQKMLALRPLRFEKRDQGPDRMVSGVMVRHMVLPGCLESTRHVLRWFAEHCAGRAMLSLMFQYTSISPRGTAPVRRVNKTEYRTVLHWLDECGIEDGYCQDLSPDARWIPDFEQVNPFPTELSIPVWHWRRGFV